MLYSKKISIIYVLLLLFVFYTHDLLAICAIFLAFTVILVFYTKDVPIIFLSTLLLLYANYSIVMLRYLVPELCAINEGIDNVNFDLQAVRCMTLFMGCLTYKMRKYKKVYTVKPALPNNHNYGTNSKNSRKYGDYKAVAFTVLILLLIWVVFYEYNPNSGERSGYSPMYEYSTVFFIMGYYFARGNKKLNFAIIAIALFYIVFDFLGGQRSTGVQIGIISVISLFYRYLSSKRIVLLAVVGIIITTAVALFRDEFSISNISMNSIMGESQEMLFASTTSAYAYYTSLTFIGTMEHYPFIVRLFQFFQYLLSLILPGNVGEPITALAEKFYVHYYGGMLPIYVYYYIGYIGPILMAWIVAKYYKIMFHFEQFKFDQRYSYYYIICIYVTATTLRWYNYSPNPLLRGVMLLCLVMLIYKKIFTLK